MSAPHAGPALRGVLTDRTRAVLRALWDNMAALAAVNLVVCLSLVPAAACLWAGTRAPVPLLALVPGTAACAGAVATALGALSGDVLGRRAWGAAMLRAAPVGARIGLLAGLALTAAGYDVRVYRTGHAPWVLVGLLPDGAVLGLIAAAGGQLLVLGVRYRLRGRRLWCTALYCAARRPAATLSAVILSAVSALLLVEIGPGLLLLLPGPVCVLVCAVTGPAVEEVSAHADAYGGDTTGSTPGPPCARPGAPRMGGTG